MTAEPLLAVEQLSISFAAGAATFEVVSAIDFTLQRGRTLCLVGESGCGKSITAMALLGLLPRTAKLSAKAVRFENIDLAAAGETALRKIRGRKIGTIFQEPMTSLNPTMTIGAQIGDVLRQHLGLGRAAARARAIELLDMVRIARAGERVDDYPFMFSGGMRQRAMIALALACAPALLIADEPTTALDVTVQAEILDLLRGLQRATGTALLMITHDLGVVAEMADEVAVMYAGRIVEQGSARQLFEHPEHPYTIGLLGSLPSPDSGRRLTPIRGRVPSPAERGTGCRFMPRCPFSITRCLRDEPALRNLSAGQSAACWQAPLEVTP